MQECSQDVSLAPKSDECISTPNAAAATSSGPSSSSVYTGPSDASESSEQSSEGEGAWADEEEELDWGELGGGAADSATSGELEEFEEEGDLASWREGPAAEQPRQSPASAAAGAPAAATAAEAATAAAPAAAAAGVAEASAAGGGVTAASEAAGGCMLSRQAVVQLYLPHGRLTTPELWVPARHARDLLGPGRGYRSSYLLMAAGGAQGRVNFKPRELLRSNGGLSAFLRAAGIGKHDRIVVSTCGNPDHLHVALATPGDGLPVKGDPLWRHPRQAWSASATGGHVTPVSEAAGGCTLARRAVVRLGENGSSKVPQLRVPASHARDLLGQEREQRSSYLLLAAGGVQRRVKFRTDHILCSTAGLPAFLEGAGIPRDACITVSTCEDVDHLHIALAVPADGPAVQGQVSRRKAGVGAQRNAAPGGAASTPSPQHQKRKRRPAAAAISDGPSGRKPVAEPVAAGGSCPAGGAQPPAKRRRLNTAPAANSGPAVSLGGQAPGAGAASVQPLGRGPASVPHAAASASVASTGHETINDTADSPAPLLAHSVSASAQLPADPFPKVSVCRRLQLLSAWMTAHIHPSTCNWPAMTGSLQLVFVLMCALSHMGMRKMLRAAAAQQIWSLP